MRFNNKTLLDIVPIIKSEANNSFKISKMEDDDLFAVFEDDADTSNNKKVPEKSQNVAANIE